MTLKRRCLFGFISILLTIFQANLKALFFILPGLCQPSFLFPASGPDRVDFKHKMIRFRQGFDREENPEVIA